MSPLSLGEGPGVRPYQATNLELSNLLTSASLPKAGEYRTDAATSCVISINFCINLLHRRPANAPT